MAGYRGDGEPVRKARVYRDLDGNTCKVMPGIGERAFKARKSKPGAASWKGMRQLAWRESFDEAQAYLDEYAKDRGWYRMGARTEDKEEPRC